MILVYTPLSLELDPALSLLPLLVHHVPLVLALQLVLLPLWLLRASGLLLFRCFKTFLCLLFKACEFPRPVTALLPLVCNALFHTWVRALHGFLLIRCWLRCFFSTHFLELFALLRGQHSRCNPWWPPFLACFLGALAGIARLSDLSVFCLGFRCALVCGHSSPFMSIHDLGVQELAARLRPGGFFVRFFLGAQLLRYCLRLTGGDIVFIA